MSPLWGPHPSSIFVPFILNQYSRMWMWVTEVDMYIPTCLRNGDHWYKNAVEQDGQIQSSINQK